MGARAWDAAPLTGAILLNRRHVVTPICAKILGAERQREDDQMLMSRTLRLPIAVAAVLVGVLLSAPAFAQAHIRGTLTDVKDGTIGVQNAKGETISIKLASDAGLFLVTKADMSAIQSGKFVGITSFEQDGKRVAREVHVFDESLRGLAEGHYPWDLDSKPNMMTNANIEVGRTVCSSSTSKAENRRSPSRRARLLSPLTRRRQASLKQGARSSSL
jgi:hypothetical protein